MNKNTNERESSVTSAEKSDDETVASVLQMQTKSNTNIHKMENIAFYSKYALAGGICCTLTHGSVVPIDVIKTRLQISNQFRGFSECAMSIYKSEGLSAFGLGLGATVIGYGLQGACKFGFFQYFKDLYYSSMEQENGSSIFSPSTMWMKTLGINLVTSSLAEIIGTTALIPWEALRIRTVDKPQIYKSMSMINGIRNIYKVEGSRGFTNSLGPILFKQVPYTCVQLSAFSMLNEYVDNTVLPQYFHVEKNQLKTYNQLLVTVVCGTLAGTLSAIASHPADTLLSKVNSMSKHGSAQMNWVEVYKVIGFRKLWVGLLPRIAMVSMMSAIMFFIYDSVKLMVGLSLTTKTSNPTKTTPSSNTVKQ